MILLTATHWRQEIAEVWCAAVSATLKTKHKAIVLFAGDKPECPCQQVPVPWCGPSMSLYAIEKYAFGPVKMFLEEDMIPVRDWDVDEYPGKTVAAQGNVHGQPWPALLIKRAEAQESHAIVPQRYVRDGGCPDWLPRELCDPCLEANAKILGNHFIHIDKMYRRNVPELTQKNTLLNLLRHRFGLPQAKASDGPPKDAVPSKAKQVLGRPGSELKAILSGPPFWIVPERGKCKCNERAALMDSWGVDGCRKRQGEIVKWLSDEAKAAGWPLPATGAAGLVLLAINRAARAESG